MSLCSIHDDRHLVEKSLQGQYISRIYAGWGLSLGELHGCTLCGKTGTQSSPVMQYDRIVLKDVKYGDYLAISQRCLQPAAGRSDAHPL